MRHNYTPLNSSNNQKTDHFVLEPQTENMAQSLDLTINLQILVPNNLSDRNQALEYANVKALNEEISMEITHRACKAMRVSPKYATYKSGYNYVYKNIDIKNVKLMKKWDGNLAEDKKLISENKIIKNKITDSQTILHAETGEQNNIKNKIAELEKDFKNLTMESENYVI